METHCRFLAMRNPWRVWKSKKVWHQKMPPGQKAFDTLLGKKERKNVKSLCRVWLFATPWTVARQAPLSMGFSRQEYWSGLSFPSPGDIPNPGIESCLHCRQMLYPLSHQESPTGEEGRAITNTSRKNKAAGPKQKWCSAVDVSHGEGKKQYWIGTCNTQFSSVAQSCPTLCNPMDCSTPGFPVHHQLPEHTQTHVHHVDDAIQPAHPLSSPSPPTFNLSQNQGLFKWVSSSHQVAKVLEFQLQHQSIQWLFTIDFLKDGLVGSPCSPRDSQESSPTPQFKSINSCWHSAFITVQLSYSYMTTGKTIALTRQTFVGKVMSLF